MARYRQLPDGTWLDEQYGTMDAPVVDPLGTGRPKRQPSPSAGPGGVPFQDPRIGTHAQKIDGMGMFLPNPAIGLHMRQGRNYPALGFLDQMSATTKTVLVVGAVVGGIYLTRVLTKRGAGRRRR